MKRRERTVRRRKRDDVTCAYDDVTYAYADVTYAYYPEEAREDSAKDKEQGFTSHPRLCVCLSHWQ